MENPIAPDDQKEEQLTQMDQPSIQPEGSSSSEASDSENDDEKLKAIMNQEESSSDEFQSAEDDVQDITKHEHDEQESDSDQSEDPHKDIKQSEDRVESDPIDETVLQQTEQVNMTQVEESKEQTGSELYEDMKSHRRVSKRISDDHFVVIQQAIIDSDLQGVKTTNEIAKSEIQRTPKQEQEDKKEVLAAQESVATSEEEEEEEDVDDDDDDDESLDLSEGAKQRLFDEEMKNDDDDEDIDDSDDGESDDDDSDSDEIGSNKDSDSFMEEDIANRSLNAEDEDELVVIDNLNYLKYVSDRFNQQTDILEIVDRNERNFKQLAEKMIQQTSFLVQPVQSTDSDDHGAPIAKRLMHFTHLPSITETFHSTQSKSGFPYSICAVEQYIGVGSSDGGVRVFDHNEREIKLLIDKSVKNVPVVSVDMVRMRFDCIYVVAGHQKGQIAIYEIKGLRADHEPAGQILAKHLKTMTDVHDSPVVSIKFFGELSYESQKKIQVVSCDLDGVVYLTYYRDGMLGYQCLKQCFMKNRMGPTFSIAPFFIVSNKFDSSDVKQVQAASPYQQEELLMNSKQTQLVAFGSLSRILIAQISPQAKELVFIDKPDYIEMGTVPYLDWGYGLSPCCRDKSYPMLAIAWGKILQLALYTNYQKPSPGVTTDETPNLQYDGFYICDFNIDSCFFLSESILFVLVNKKEVRILYTQNFTPGLFDESYQLNDMTGRQPQTSGVKLGNQQDRRQYFMTLKEKFVGQVSTYAEKDRGYRLLQNDEIKFKDNPYTGNNPQQRSNYNYNPTICKNKDNTIVALGKSSMGQGSLLHWEEYLDLIRKTNQDNDCWLMTLKAALDIYNGKMIGLAGIPDHKETREQMLRDEMKDLLRQNIDSCIKEFQEGACVSTRTLRVALEFCIRVNALDHLFGELFTMFAEAGMEQRFFENLEPFILSGKFKQTKIPKKILVRLIEFYRQKDVEVLEKILLNLNLSKYKNILEVRHICETEFLTSALIHILTNLFDKDNENTVCLQLLCSLYNMMTKSQTVKEKTDIFKLKDYDYNYAIDSQQVLSKKEKLEIEHSQTYIGYKLMWVMRMFLEGKKFPQGTLSAFKWRIYVYDIVRFATNDKFLGWFLAFDPDCFFKLMKTLFLDQEPYEYIQSQHGFIEMYKDSINGLDACMTHIQIVDALQQQVIAYIVRDREQNNGLLSQRGEQSLNAFIFFIAQISRKPTVPVPTQLGVYVVREHLKFYRKLMKIPEITSEALNMLSSIGAYQQQQTQQLQGSKKNQRQAAKQDKITRLYLALIKKNERDVISLLQRMEESGLESDDVSSLLLDAEKSPMFKVRVYLMQLQKNHKGCLEVYFKVPAIREDVFVWLNELESKQRQLGDAGSTEDTKESLNKLILNYIPKLVGMDASHTIKLVEQWLMEDSKSSYDHLQIVDERLKNDTDLTFKYLSTLLTDKEPQIYDEHQKLLIGGGGPGFAKYKELVLRFVKVLLQTVGEKRYRGMLADFVKKKYVPIEESQNMIIEFKDKLNEQPLSPKKRSKPPREREINEALAILSKRLGESERAIDLYIKVLLELSQQEVVSALYISNGEVPFDDTTLCNGNQHIMKFDSLVQDIMRICDKVGGTESEQETLWLHAIRSLYRLKSELFDEGSKQGLQQKEKKDHKRFATFHMIRVQYFMRRMSEHVSIPKIIQFLEDINEHSNHPIRYQECRAPFEEKMRTELHHENILNNAAQLLLKDLNADFSVLKHLHQRGLVNEKDKCDHCKRGLQSRWDPQSVCVYSCGHSFHQRCAQNNGFKCSLCLNEYEEIQQIINQRGVRRGGKSRRNGDDDQESESTQSGRSSSKSRERNAVTEEAPMVRKSFDIEKEQRNQFLDQFNISMIKFEAGLADNVLRINYF